MSVQVKICGLKTTRALDTALDAGADYFGLVFYAPSPRNVEHEAAAILAERADAGGPDPWPCWSTRTMKRYARFVRLSRLTSFNCTGMKPRTAYGRSRPLPDAL